MAILIASSILLFLTIASWSLMGLEAKGIESISLFYDGLSLLTAKYLAHFPTRPHLLNLLKKYQHCLHELNNSINVGPLSCARYFDHEFLVMQCEIDNGADGKDLMIAQVFFDEQHERWKFSGFVRLGDHAQPTIRHSTVSQDGL